MIAAVDANLAGCMYNSGARQYPCSSPTVFQSNRVDREVPFPLGSCKVLPFILGFSTYGTRLDSFLCGRVYPLLAIKKRGVSFFRQSPKI